MNFEVKEPLKELVKQELLKNNNLDVHQAIMNVCYDSYKQNLDTINQQREIQGNPKQPWEYTALVEQSTNDFGELAGFAIMFGKYNEQVENGGHQQYWYNDYASMNYRTREIYHHANLICCFKDFKAEVEDILNKSGNKLTNSILDEINQVENILLAFPENLVLNVSSKLANFTEDGDKYEFDEDYNENELTNESIEQLNWLDNRYYKVNHAVMEILNQYFMNYLFDDKEQAELESKIKTTDNK